jgi:hypothetical protein
VQSVSVRLFVEEKEIFKILMLQHLIVSCRFTKKLENIQTKLPKKNSTQKEAEDFLK